MIKANIPSRMAFAVSSLADSRVILDQPGAERLVGKGDLLLLGPASSVAQRIQGCWVSEEEVRKVVAHWRRQAIAPAYATIPGIDTDDGPGAVGFDAEDADDEALVRAAMDLVVRSQLGSTSMLQRKLKVGFARAGRHHGPARAAWRGRPVGGVQGPGGADDARGARPAPPTPSER